MATRFTGYLIAATLLLLSALNVLADACKPDMAGTDRITKKPVMQWQQQLSSSGFLAAALMDNDVTVTAFIARAGDKNLVMVVIAKEQENLARAAFESRFNAAKGDQLTFGFKDGEPVSFKVTGAVNRSQAVGLLTAKLRMSAEWDAEVPDGDLAAAKTALTTKLIDTIRITQANGPIDQPVPEKIGRRLTEKFGCFYQTLEANGIDLNAGPASHAGAQAGSNTENQKQGQQLTIDQIMQMIAAKIADDIIITTIRNSPSKFDLTPETMIKLKAAGASDAVIRAMTR